MLFTIPVCACVHLGMAKLMFTSLSLSGSMCKSGGTALKGTMLRAAVTVMGSLLALPV